MNNGITNNNSFGLQSNFINQKPAGLNFGKKFNSANEAYYAKKGEPMYIKEMDADEDGVVSFDEFKEYCQANGISTKEMVRMSEMASSWRAMNANKNSDGSFGIKSKDKKENKSAEQKDSEAVYAKKGDSNYDELMDTNNDNKVTYKEYIEYCKEHSKSNEQKSNTKIEETEDGEFKISSSDKAVRAYTDSDAENSDFNIDERG